MGKTAQNPVCHIISFRVTEDEKDAIEALAKRRKTSVSKYLRDNVYTIFETELIAYLAGKEIPEDQHVRSYRKSNSI